MIIMPVWPQISFGSNKVILSYLILALYLLSNMAAENNGKPLKTKFEKIEKKSFDFCWFGSAVDEYDRI